MSQIKTKKYITLLIFLGGVFLISNSARAIIPTQTRIIKCQKKIKKAESTPGSISQAELDKCTRIIEQAKNNTLQKKNIATNQWQLYNLKYNKTDRNLKKTEKELERNKMELERTEKELLKKDKEMIEFKKQLRKNIVLYERNQQNFKINILNAESSLARLMNRANYLDKLSKEINVKLKSIKDEKEVIIQKQEDIKKVKQEVEKNKEELKEKRSKLETQRRIKSDFLSEIKGDENKYKMLLARIEEQKQRIMNLSSLSVSTKSSIAEIKRKAKKPKSGLASTSWYYDQADPRWGRTTIGFSRTLMKDYGCAVTALSMAFTEAGKKIKPGKMAKKPLFYRDLIVWPNEWKGLKLKSGRGHGNVSWSKIDSQLKAKGTVIVFIRARGGAGHYVVIHHKDKKGKYVVHDPLFGANIFLETSKKLVSAVYKSSVRIDQMLIYR